MLEFVFVLVAIVHSFVSTGPGYLEAWQRGHFVAVGSVKPAMAALDLYVISMPKAKKKKSKKKSR